MNRKAFVLLSGGLDSTTALHKAIIDYIPNQFAQGISTIFKAEKRVIPIDWVEAVSIRYGQRHFVRECTCATQTCKRLGIAHKIIDIEYILGKSMLTDSSIPIPNTSYAEIKGVSPTYVPFRNGTLLSVITSHAQSWVNENQPKDSKQNQLRMEADGYPPEFPEAGVYFGAHSEDAQNWAYPDCTPEFIGAMANAIYIGSYRAIRLHTPLQWLTKAEIVKLGDELNVDFASTWSCYAGNEVHCGVCPTCRARKEAFRIAEVEDPTQYAT